MSITFPVQYWFAIAGSCSSLRSKVQDAKIRQALDRITGLIQESSAGPMFALLGELPFDARLQYVDGVFKELSGDETLTSSVEDWVVLWLAICRDAQDLRDDREAYEGFMGIASDIVFELLKAGYSGPIREVVGSLGLSMPDLPANG